jgi:predicted membrane-bound spermidine synthase
MQLVFPEAWGYVGMVPSFGGEWGFVMVQKPVRATEPRLEGQSAETLAEALPRSYRPSRQMLNEWRARLQVRAGEMGFKYLVADKLDAYFTPDADMQPVMVEPNTLSNQKLVSYYDAAWRNWGDSSY